MSRDGDLDLIQVQDVVVRRKPAVEAEYSKAIRGGSLGNVFGDIRAAVHKAMVARLGVFNVYELEKALKNGADPRVKMFYRDVGRFVARRAGRTISDSEAEKVGEAVVRHAIRMEKRLPLSGSLHKIKGEKFASLMVAFDETLKEHGFSNPIDFMHKYSKDDMFRAKLNEAFMARVKARDQSLWEALKDEKPENIVTSLALIKRAEMTWTDEARYLTARTVKEMGKLGVVAGIHTSLSSIQAAALAPLQIIASSVPGMKDPIEIFNKSSFALGKTYQDYVESLLYLRKTTQSTQIQQQAL